MPTFTLRAKFARRLPDPILDQCDRHVLLCAVEDIPTGMPFEQSNVRPQNTNKRVYKEVSRHLRNENEEGAKNIFHLKNKGITILAERVTCRDRDKDLYEVAFANDSQGIVDGGHTYKIITDNQGVIAAENQRIQGLLLPEEEKEKLYTRQYVKVEVLTGLNSGLTTEIARGLNTAVQVEEQTLANHAGKFQWIKDDFAGQPFLSKIAFRENEEGLLDVSDILRILELFNIADYPNDASGRHPTRAYTGKEIVLAGYLKRPGAIMQLRPLLRDILVLHDTVSHEARNRWNDAGGKRRGAALAFIDVAEKGKTQFEFPFIGKSGEHRLFRGALFPMLAAFRWMVVEDPDTRLARWRGSFDDVLALWQALAGKLIEATRETSDELGRKADAIGKSSNHWKNLYNVVAFHQAVTMSAAGR